MAERCNALQLLVARFLLCICIGWIGFSSLRKCLIVNRHDELKHPPYSSNIVPGQTMAAAAGTFLFFWTLSTLSVVCFAHGGTLMVTELVDGVALVFSTVALGLQSTYLPTLPKTCGSATSWQVASNYPSFFTIVAGSESQAEKLCWDMVISWGCSIGILSVFWLSVVYNLRLSIKEFGSADCYWIHDFGGNKRSFGAIATTLCLPLFATEYLLEALWTAIPHNVKVWFRYRRQANLKYRRYKDLQAKLQNASSSSDTLSPPSSFDLEVVHAVKNPQGTPYLIAQTTESALKAIKGTLFAEWTYRPAIHPITIISDHVFLKNQTLETTSPFFAKLPWHLIINDLLPHLHYTDVLHLLLTSRSTYRAILPSATVDRQLLRHQTCDQTFTGGFWAPPKLLRSSCFSCSIPVCSSCSTRRELSETPITTHTSRCKPVCIPCYKATLSQPNSYGKRQWSRGCSCTHNRIVYSACSNGDHSSSSSLSRFSWSIQGNRRLRDLCNTCSCLSNADVKRIREERVRRKRQHQPGWELDEKGRRGVFTCGMCREQITMKDSKVPVCYFVCQLCSKECRYTMHDQWVVEDALANSGIVGIE
ncbi:hypothetical protein R6Q59_010173 [Mikania micrantha]